ncbi:hypothetical protein SAMN05660841_02667 [Sphingobacterium nematocida]|uniref:Thioredoxin domain-containing protein n=1 Tax=Sphingobacterium nematocida TaxID=1513896 RepID=A0A1T5EKZ8_9SPHI|nr:thioredoxin family protein [Sphingobacterium nematocida]SKB84539.1 hypothetical protein SAMN05660841_02667 [Sphingobacterium nematocida]
MKQFFRGGRGLPKGQSDKVTKLSRYKIGTSFRDKDLSNRPIENDRLPTVSSQARFVNYLVIPTDVEGSKSHIFRPVRLHCVSLRVTCIVTRFLLCLIKKLIVGKGASGVKLKAYSLLPTALIITFCVLFGSALAQSRIQFGTADQGFKRSYDFSLYRSVTVKPIQSANLIAREQAKYPKVDYTQFPQELFNVDPDMLPQIQIGERLPDAVLDMPLRVVNDAYARDTITLRSCMDKPWIILDLWTEWCAPCIASMNKWEALAKQENSNFTLLGLYASFESHRAMPEARKKEYVSTQVIGPATSILAHLFFNGKYSLGPSIWIKDGCFFGISQAGMLKEEDYHLLLEGKLDVIPDYAQWKPIAH